METKIKPTYKPLPSGWYMPDKIELRWEQNKAIAVTKEYFSKALNSQHTKQGKKDTAPKSPKFLWNAKMRFGKTLSTLELLKQMGIRRTLIVTHRPAVKDQWHEDFNKIFADDLAAKSRFGYRLDHESADDRRSKQAEGVLEFDELRRFVNQTDDHQIVFFVSMQYLRLSSKVGGGDHNKEKARILDAEWDMVIIDEAHEGTKTDRGENVIDYLARTGVMMLHLSGTPFNIYEQFSKDQIFSWDYPQEQEMKESWESIPGNEGKSNPYITLPRMNIMRYDMSRMVEQYVQNMTDSVNGNMAVRDGEFKFTEFFRVDEDRESDRYGKFVHEEEVKDFIRKLRKEDDNNFPFSNEEFRRSFAHTLWIVPRVKQAKALEELLYEDPVFKKFKIINVAGQNDDDLTDDDALNRVNKRIDPRYGGTEKRSITISCGRLTTGVTVRPWTAVLYMKGSDLTSPATYMQTIFRVQSPYTYTDTRTGLMMMKSQCYAFDFAPTRTLNMVAETAVLATKISKENQKRATTGKNRKEADRAQSLEHMSEMLRHLDMMNYDGAGLVPIDAYQLFSHLNGAYADRITRNGFDDFRLFDFDAIDSMTQEERKALGEDAEWLKGVTSGGSGDKPKGSVPLDLTHLSDEQNAALEEARKKVELYPEYEEWWKNLEKLERTMATFYHTQNGKSLHLGFKAADNTSPKKNPKKTAEETEVDKLKAEQEKERKALASTLKAVAVRIPLLIYGADLKGKYAKDGVTIDNITEIVDDASWREFMPKNGNKEIDKKWFRKYKKFFHGEIFRLAGQKYRRLADEADDMHTEERIQRIAEIFQTFRNPDKETVLTPWRVVNMHMAETIGGHCFYNETFTEENTVDAEIEVDGVKRTVKTHAPRLIPLNEVSSQCFDNINPLSGESNARILEINSKTGLYPLYVAYSIYRPLIDKYWSQVCEDGKNTSVKEEQAIWDQVLRDNVFVVCKTDMARSITQRTLRGSRKDEKGNDVRVNAVYPQWAIKNENRKPLQLSYGREIASGESAKVDIVDILRLDAGRFETDVTRREWWETVDPHNKLKFNKEMPKKIPFDAVVGNPPYQLMDGGGRDGGASTTLYDKFLSSAKKINSDIISMIIPAKWFSGGRGLDGFRKEMLSDKRIVKMVDFIDSKDCFPSVDIPGGVCFFLRAKSQSPLCKVKTINNGRSIETERLLSEDDVFVRDPKALSIIKKIREKTEVVLSSVVMNSNPFGFRSFEDGQPQPYPNSVRLYTSRGWSYVDRDKVNCPEHIDRYKVIMSKTAAEHANKTDKQGKRRVISKLLILPPGSISSESYLVLFSFDNEQDAKRALKYTKTKLLRFLLNTILLTQNIAKDKFRNIPLQDFSSNSSIPWDSSVAEIDDYLMTSKYELDKEQQDYIHSVIKPMPKEKEE